MSDLKPYPAMKASGVLWLGEVPEHWEVRKLRNVLRGVAERNRQDLPLLSVVREKGVILRDVTNRDENHNFIPDDLTNYKVVRKGQFVMNKMKAWQGSYGVSRHDGIVSPAYFIFDIDRVDGAYFHSVIRSKAYVPFFTQASDGVRIGQWDLSQARMKEIPFFIPPVPEQAGMVRFLDYMDRRIWGYILAKQKLIKLLEEQKQVIIHRAVTRGLDPNVRLKPSGVEWLGDVPEHWQIAKLVRLTTRIGDGLHGTPAYVDESGYHFINGNNLSSGAVKITTSTRCVNEVEFQKHKIALDDSTLLMSINGTIGNVAFYRGESLVLGKSAAYINCDKSLGRSFLFFFLQSSAAKEFFQLELTGTTIFVSVHVVGRKILARSYRYRVPSRSMNAKRPFSQALLDQTPAAVQDYLEALEARVAALEALVQQMREQLQQDSRTSSRPPSSDPPQALAKRPRHEPTGRRPGGQPGHEGQTRVMVPIDTVDVVVPVKPARCRRCQHPLQGKDPQPQRHQVTEIPPVKPVVTEYQLHQLVCPACGEVTRAEVPPGVPTGGFGPRLQATTALCTGAYHLSKRTTQALLQAFFGVEVGLGTLANLEQATTQAVAEPVSEARAYVRRQPAAYADETGWREGHQRAWLWTAVTAWVTVFLVRRSRGGQVAQELLGEGFWGWLVTDRWSAYTWYPRWRRQLCWAHLLRDIEAMIARGGRSQEIGEALRGEARKMFHWWHRVRDGTLTQASFRTYMQPVRREVERLLEAGQTCGVPKTEGTCRELCKLRQALWTFVRHPEVEPTNNAAERAIRPGVLWRKGSFGTQSAEGSRFVEAMMTVVATLKQQHRNVLDYVTAACQAALSGEPAPSLLPTREHLAQLRRLAA